MHVTRGRHREPVSYHLFCDALDERGADESALFARAVRRAVSGLVTHGQYAQAARGNQRMAGVERRLALALEVDANPVAALFPPAVGQGAFEARWNALNQAVHWGVKTFLVHGHANADEDRGRVRRVPANGGQEADDVFRAALMGHGLALLSGRARVSLVDDAHVLLALCGHLGLQRAVVREVLALLHEEPDAGIDRCAARLATSVRTLQRQLAREGLVFAELKQAVRVTMAGHRMRHRDESLTATAHASGFFDSAHMAHAWQVACGISPSAYRAIVKVG